MGIKYLQSYIRREVPNGCLRVNILDEITSYCNNSKCSEPIIIVDSVALMISLCQSDKSGQICGGRFNRAYSIIDRFFGQLTQRGAKLVIFFNGRVTSITASQHRTADNKNLNKLMNVADAVDEGADIGTLANLYNFPRNYICVINQLTKIHGIAKFTVHRQFKGPEFAAYANSVNAFAVISSNNNSFLMFEGAWRRWWLEYASLENYVCDEYNREILLQTLGLSNAQVPLFACLAGNTAIPYEQLKRFHSQFGTRKNRSKIFPGLASFVQQNWRIVNEPHAMRRLLSQIYCQSSVSRQMIDTFRTSLQEYNTNYLPESNPAKNEITELLLNRDQPFLYFIWMGQIWNVVTNFIDGRQSELGGQFPRLIIPIIQRQAGIILFHKRHQRQILSVTDVKLAIKLSHSSEYEEKTYPAQFPEHISPPELPDLYSSEAELRENLFTTKIKLYCWIACNELDHRVLETIPERLRVTATTLYFLMENQILQLFEADVILQVAYEVIHETYDFRKIQHPSHLDSRAFHVIFVYEEFYNYFLDAFKLVGLDEKHVCNYPPLDGVLFHNKYAEWKEGKGDLKQISSWRIYENIPQRDA